MNQDRLEKVFAHTQQTKEMLSRTTLCRPQQTFSNLYISLMYKKVKNTYCSVEANFSKGRKICCISLGSVYGHMRTVKPLLCVS